METCIASSDPLVDLVLTGFYSGVALAFGLWLPGALGRFASRHTPEAD